MQEALHLIKNITPSDKDPDSEFEIKKEIFMFNCTRSAEFGNIKNENI